MNKNDRSRTIYKTVSKWADGIGIVSIASQEKLCNMLENALDAKEAETRQAAQQRLRSDKSGVDTVPENQPSN